MKDIFIFFYAVLFGALLSAEIGLHHFKVADSSWSAWAAWAWRIVWLVIARAGFFAWAYARLFAAGSMPNVTALQAAAALLLCTPIFGFQQLSYVLVSPPADAAAWRLSWLVNGVVFGAIPVLIVWVKTR